jgi:DNA-binding NarL/FixJ family response regulator
MDNAGAGREPGSSDESLRTALSCHRQAAHVHETHIALNTEHSLRQRFDEYVLDGGFGLLPEIAVIAPVILAQGGIVYSQSDVVARNVYYRSRMYERYLREHRVEDMLSAVRLRADGFVVGLSVLRLAGARRFSSRDEAVLRLLTNAAAVRLGERLTTREQIGRHSLPPRLRQTLAALLDGASEKEIAYRLAICRATAHEYVTALYRRFRVRSRAELMAHFVRRRPIDSLD